MDPLSRLIYISSRPVPLRSLLVRKLLSRWPIGSFSARLEAGAVERPTYAFCLYHAAREAKALGFKAITAVEMGVAGGNGILNLCRHRDEIRKELGIEIHLVGFDTGVGLPRTDDPRDVWYYWPPGSYEMDRPALEKRLAGRAEIIFGDVAETVPQWQAPPDAPLGAVLFDLDLYTSTTAALGLLTKENVLPRIWCFFDDIIASPMCALADRTGVREAIRQFNKAPEREVSRDHISRAHVFAHNTPESWHQQIHVYHRLTHPSYNTSIYGTAKLQLGLTP